MFALFVEQQTLEGRIAALHGDVEDLRNLLNQTLKHLPAPGTRNLTSSKFAAEIGVSKRTLLRWCESGRMDPSCYVRKQCGNSTHFIFDRQRATVCAEQIQRGDR